MSKGMAADRPLWDIRVLSNYNWGQETVLVVRVHQVLTDGISLLKVIQPIDFLVNGRVYTSLSIAIL